MARLKEYNGHYCESEYEYAFIGFLEEEGWKYTSGNKISRVTKRDVLIEEDFKKFIADGNPDLTEDEVTQIYDTVRLVGAESDFAALHKVYNWMVDGIQFTPEDGIARMIPLINFETDKEADGIVINDKCKNLAIKVKEIIDTKSSFTDWLNNQNVRDQLKLEIKICLVKNGYPPQYSPEVFKKVMEQVENFEEYSGETVEKGNNASAKVYQYEMPEGNVMMVAEKATPYGKL